MTAFYSEWEAYPAQWTRNLIAAGHIAPGVVDERSISDLSAEDVRGFDQAHFFAGISVWSYALRLAGIPDGFPCWSGSCPCQGFSSAGRKRGFEDERHLWPEWFRLIEANRPPVIFGEQVSSPDGLKWLDLVSSQLEGIGYSFGAIVTCASGIGAPHQRHRMYFVAHTKEFRWGTWRPTKRRSEWLADTNSFTRDQGRSIASGSDRRSDAESWARSRSGSSADLRVADPDGERLDGQRVRVQQGQSREDHAEAARNGETNWLADADDSGRGSIIGNVRAGESFDGGSSAAVWLGNANSDGAGQHARELQSDEGQHEVRGEVSDHALESSSAARALGHPHHQGLAQQLGQSGVSREATAGAAGQATERAGAPTTGFWANAEWVYCADGKYRPTEPGVAALAAGSPGRVGQIKAYGNALNAWQAATFIRAFIEATYDCTQHP